jgi:hypothetical protein
MARALRHFRTIEIVVSGLFVAIAAICAAAGQPIAVAVFLGIAGIAVLLFEWRLRAHRRVLARVRAALERIGQRELDGAAVQLRDPDDAAAELAGGGVLGALIASRTTRMFVAGTRDGRGLEIGTAIMAARDGDQTVSYVRVVERDLPGRFRLMTRGLLASMAKRGSDLPAVTTGDAGFDERWLLVAGDDRWRAVLDAGLRARLVELAGRVGWMQAARLEATAAGVVAAWPGELSADWLVTLRDLAITVHDRLARRAGSAAL